jgi:Kef-type K+ transport system membrane component KefB
MSAAHRWGEAQLAAAAPLAHDRLALFLLQIGVLLAAGWALGRLALRLRLPALVGELAAGVLLGPTLLGNAAPALAQRLFPQQAPQSQLLDAFCQFGVVLLVAVTGAQFDARMLKRRGSLAMRVSLAGVLLPLGLGIATGHLVPDALLGDAGERGVFALFLGVAMCVTAIPVIAKTLADLNLLHRNVGQLVIAAALFDDAVGWLLLALVSALAAGTAVGAQLALTATWTALLLLAAAVAGPRLAARMKSPHTALTGGLVLVVLGAAATAAAGMEALFGAFVAGVTVLRHLDARHLSALRTLVTSLFAPVFLAAVGLRVDLTALADPAVLAAGLGVLLVATAGKFTGAYLAARSAGMSHYEGLALGAGMNSRGMIEIVIALTGLRLGVLNTASFTVIVLVAIATSATTPVLLRWAAGRIAVDAEEEERARRLAAWEPTPHSPAEVGEVSASPPTHRNGARKKKTERVP